MRRPGYGFAFVVAAAVAAAVVPASPAAAAPPDNDDRAAPVAVAFEDGVYEDVRDVSEATTALDDPDCFAMGSTVWYSLVGTGNDIIIDTGASSYQTAVAVISESGEMIACSDRGPDGGAQAEVRLMPGEAALVAIGSPDGDYGSILGVRVKDAAPPPDDGALEEEPPPPPPPPAPAPANDTRGGATPLGPLPASHEVDTSGATSDGTELQGHCGSAYSVWFSYSPSGDEHVAIDTLGSGYDTQLSVLQVDPAEEGRLHEVACNQDALGGEQSRVELDLRAGASYLVLVTSQDSFGDYGSGHLVLNAAEITPLVVTVAAAAEGVVSRDGLAFVDVTVTCSRPANGGVGVRLSQQAGDRVVRGDGSSAVPECGPTPLTRRVPVFPSEVGGFRPGPVSAVATGEATSLEVTVETVHSFGVRLRPA